jgi:hypothetical protein
MRLQEESRRATRMLKHKAVRRISRCRRKEVLIEFTDGTRFYVDWQEKALELSITRGIER